MSNRFFAWPIRSLGRCARTNSAHWYHPGWGRPGLPVRLMVGLHYLYLRHAFDESDEPVAARLPENPCWQ